MFAPGRNTKSTLIKISTLCVVFLMSAGLLYAWDPPLADPPSGNAKPPIDVSDSPQTKTGPLEIEGTLDIKNNLCLGGVCKDKWMSLNPPVCQGPNKGLQYDGKNWSCVTISTSDCVSETCSSADYECGQHDDGCGNTIDCGNCPNGHICSEGDCVECIDNGLINEVAYQGKCCKPDTCSFLGYECGTTSDGCGNTIDCGGCPDPEKVCHEHTCKNPGVWIYTDVSLPTNTPYYDDDSVERLVNQKCPEGEKCFMIGDDCSEYTKYDWDPGTGWFLREYRYQCAPEQDWCEGWECGYHGDVRCGECDQSINYCVYDTNGTHCEIKWYLK